MHYHPEITRALANERSRDLIAEASAWRRFRTHKAARKAARQAPSPQARAAPQPGASTPLPSTDRARPTSRKVA